MALQQIQSQTLSQQQLQSIALLQMSTLELEAYIQESALENPLIDVNEDRSEPDESRELLEQYIWLEERDYQNRYYDQSYDEELDPLARVGTDGGLEETLYSHVLGQLRKKALSEDMYMAVLFLAGCLDENGFLIDPMDELSAECGVPEPTLTEALKILRSLDPPGIGAGSAAECLSLQLKRRGCGGCAEKVVSSCLDLLARGDLRGIARRLGVSLREVKEAAQAIRSLDPYPCRDFQRQQETAFVRPDVIITGDEGCYRAVSARGERPFFTVNRYYLDLLKTTRDTELKKYLSDKLQQTRELQWATDLRSSTLLRCAEFIARQQSGFFDGGPTGLKGLRMADAARELDVHVSTVSRAVRMKYISCSRGLFPMSYFFSRSLGPAGQEAAGSAQGARELLARLIAEEPSLTDARLAERLGEQGFPLSRRTVAKYRQELALPKASRRQKGR